MSKLFKVFLAVLLVATSTTALFAHGKRDIEEKSVENLNSWQEDFELDGKKEGKFNLFITAKDMGGNTYIEGPHNIIYDKNSDLPICGITNPYPNMRVVGNLNIVGTCIDDDGVSKVELVLDEGTEYEKTVTAEGTEFWSYYLDTNDLEEGPHTIRIIGYDINDEPRVNDPKKVKADNSTVTWQLDRKQPVTNVESHGMGMLVSGSIKLEGHVSDGNGVSELSYSTDNGEHFSNIKINRTKDFAVSTFNLSVDTKKFNDGAKVIWFRAVDEAGSVGLYAFLFFIDNTKPDVQIIYPEKDENQNGQFTVAGFAKDTIGITELSWTFGTQSGDLPLIPGNPYWAVTVDSTGMKDKSAKFTIHAVDRVRNIVDVTQTIPLNQEEDKPVVQMLEPVPAQIFVGEDKLIVRGFVIDDDAVESVKIQLDNQEPIEQSTKGDFVFDLGSFSDLSVGKHKITVTGVDVTGLLGNPVVTEIENKGFAPVFDNAKVTTGKDIAEFEDGMEVHPESNSVFSVITNSPIGIKQIYTKLSYGDKVFDEKTIDLKNVPSYTASLPLVPGTPKGVLYYTVIAKDSYERTTEYNAILYVTNTSKVSSDDLQIVFSDTSVGEDGSVIVDKKHPATGYVLGGKAQTVEIVPETPFATARLYGNQIRFNYGNHDASEGSSEPVTIRVTTDKGHVVEYPTKLVFKDDTAVPTIKLNNKNITNQAVDGNDGFVDISGSVTCPTGVGKFQYRLYSAPITLDPKTRTIATFKADAEPSEFTKIDVEPLTGNFRFPLNTSSLIEGMYVVELVAESAGGNKSTAAIGVSMVPPLPEVEEGQKAPVAKAPITVFFDGGNDYNVYAISAYQGDLDQNFQIFSRADMIEGNNPVSMTVTTPDGKQYPGLKYTAVKNPTLKANIIAVNGEEYMSGKTVVMNNGATNAGTIQVEIETGAVVSSVTYEITGDEIPGGKLTTTGTAKLTKPTVDEPTKWYADIALSDLPVRVNNIAITVKAGTLVQTICGSVTVVREEAEQEDYESVYSFAAADTLYRKDDNVYILKNGSKYYFYANCVMPTAELEGEASGLKIEKNGKLFVLSATKDGVYNNVSLKVTDKYGDVYTTQPVNFIADSVIPELKLLTPEIHDWLGNTIKISGTAVDVNGIKKVEYSFDEETWTELPLSGPAAGVTFSEDVGIAKMEDGLISITLRAIDNADQKSYVYTSHFKDVTPPTVRVVEPLGTDVINGQNLIVFNAKDNAYVERTDYTSGDGAKTANIPLEPLVFTYIGTEDKPIADNMVFTFTDPAGNKTILDSWKFAIDQESDLPRCEIHVPEDDEVITRDFTISGVVYDDDGDSIVWYSIDDEEFKKVSTSEIYRQKNPAAIYEPDTSFTIHVPLDTMTDNEHRVTVYAEDLNGVKGYETSTIFKISLEEPKGAVELPKIETSVRGNVRISGWASDKNGISKVQVSLDNGNSFNDATGTTEWYYDVDTRVIPGGTQVVFLKVTDGYGIQGLYSSLINVDNDAPVLNLELPLDDSTTTGELFFSGYTYDNVEVSELYVTIRDLEKGKAPFVKPITIDRIIGEVVSLKDLDDGFYNVELTGKDKAGNVTNVSRNIHLDKHRDPATVDILYPLNGEHKQGEFTIYGQASGEYEIRELRLFLDDKLVDQTQLTSEGFFKFDLNEERITEGLHTYRVDAILSNGMAVPSLEQTLTYSPYGPWITIDNFTYGDFAIDRPFIKGRAGYSISQEEIDFYKSKDVNPEYKAEHLAKKVVKIELSFNNGKTFEVISNKNTWQYRIENQDIPEGYHFMLLRATMANGEVAITRTIIQVDNTAPRVCLIAPVINGRYNQTLSVSGLSSDDVKLEDVTVTLRQGDKASYEVPGLFQGLYFDFHFWGATLFDIGAGLTFFDDVVKLQVQWGQYTQEQRNAVCKILGQNPTSMRYGGDNVLGMKVLANIYTLPFAVFLGRDFEWLYASFAVGAQFTRFNVTGSGDPQTLSAMIIQMEFPQIKLKNRKMFSTFAFYTEGSLWFIPTDVASTGGQKIDNRVGQFAVGARINVF